MSAVPKPRQKASFASPPQQKASTSSYTNKDIVKNGYQSYLKQCIKYWKEQEANELVNVNLKTFKHQLPPPQKYLTTMQFRHLRKLRQQHRIKLIENKLETNFRLRFNGIKDMNSPKTQEELRKYKLDICNYEECPCCRYKDYAPKSIIVGKRNQ